MGCCALPAFLAPRSLLCCPHSMASTRYPNKPSSSDPKQSVHRLQFAVKLLQLLCSQLFLWRLFARPTSPTHIRQQLPARDRFDEKKSADVACNSSTLTCLTLTSRVRCFCSNFHQRTRNHVGVNHRRRRGRELRGAFHSVLGSWYDRLGKDPAGKAFHGYGECTKWSICSRFAKFPC